MGRSFWIGVAYELERVLHVQLQDALIVRTEAALEVLLTEQVLSLLA